MIVAKRKPFNEIKELLSGSKRILILGCGTCVAVCLAGGEKEVAILASQLKMALALEDQDIKIDELTIERQCDREFIEEINNKVDVDDYDLILSTACGAGVQLVSDVFDHKVVLPALNTTFIGVAEGPGIWTERCRSCGECEIDPEKDCAWTLIYNRLKKIGRLDRMEKTLPPKKYGADRYPARIVHEAYRRRYE
jgi:ferredoxin